MPVFDLPLAQLREYRPDVREPADFDASWAATLAQARGKAAVLDARPVDNRLVLVDTLDVMFRGYGGVNRYGGPKEIAVYPYNGHEGGEAVHVDRQLGWLAAVMPTPLRSAVGTV